MGCLPVSWLLLVAFLYCEALDNYFITQPSSAPYYVRSGQKGVLIPCSVQVMFAQVPYSLNWIQQPLDGPPKIISTGSDNRMSNDYELDTSCPGCYNLRIKAIDHRRDNGKFFCQVQGPRDSMSVPADVIVLVVPGKPAIFDQPTGPIKEGDFCQVECQSVGGNPPPTIEWFFTNGTKSENGVIVNASAPNAATKHTFRWRVSANEDGLSLVCKVRNVAMGDDLPPMEQLTSKFTVHYKPTVTVGPTSLYYVEKGNRAHLLCSASSNPPPTRFSWQGPAPLQQWLLQNVSFIAQKDNSGNYTCSAANTVGISYGSLMLNVLYAPEINLEDEVKVKEGAKLHVTCHVDANPPPQMVSWSGPNGFVSDTEVLAIDNVSQTHAGVYNCSAKNLLNVYERGNFARQSYRSTNVVVLHAPGKAILEKPDAAIVGGTASIHCRAQGATEYRWKAPGMPDFQSFGRDTYTLQGVKLENAGEYWCFGINEIGQGEASSILFEVHVPAVLDTFLPQERQVSENDQSFNLSCSAHGQPAPNISWFQNGSPISHKNHLSAEQNVDSPVCEEPLRCSIKVFSVLKWLDGVKWYDKGQISCSAFNGAGKGAESSMILRVKHAPVIINDPERPFVATDIGSAASIVCKVSSMPPPSFRWFRGSNELWPSVSPQYDIHEMRNESLELYSSMLIVRSVREEDLGDYLCKATSVLGDQSLKFVLQKKTKPMAPSNLEIVSKTHTSLMLAWTPGFNGGYDQQFTVKVVSSNGDTHFVNTSESFRPASVHTTHRWKRFVGIEKPDQLVLPITDLMPSETYTFQVQSSNILGFSEFSEKADFYTDDAPINPSFSEPDYVAYNQDTLTLEVDWKQSTSLDVTPFCVLVYVFQGSDKWTPFGCLKVSEKYSLDGSNASRVKVRICRLPEFQCSEAVEATYGKAVQVAIEVVVPIVIAVALLVILIAVAFICCRRRRCKQQNSKTATDSNFKIKKVKDYEMETNQARPRTISDPYMPNKGITLVSSDTTGSKDSGVFTTTGSVNYNYDGYSTGYRSMRAPSYSGEQVDAWATTYDGAQGQCQQYPYGLYNHGQNQFCSEEVIDSRMNLNDPYDNTHSSYPDPYDVSFAHVNPNAVGSQEDSINSGFSTPSSNPRRVLREIIV